MAVVRSDPFRDYDRFFQQLLGTPQSRSATMAMPLDAFRRGDQFLIQFDLPGVSAESVELTVEDNVLTVHAERPSPRSDGVETLIAERPFGTFTRQVFLGENLDTERIEANYEAGVLTLSIPVAPHAKPRRIEVTQRRGDPGAVGTSPQRAADETDRTGALANA